MKRLCVFCGSSFGADPAYRAAAEELGRELARRGIAAVYGGGNVGLMGALAETMMRASGEVIGVIPHGLMAREVGKQDVSELRVVGSMHERKMTMSELADGFIALPGGYGTLEEFFEMVTWNQLGIHRKPVGLLNVGGFFDRLLEFVDHVVAQGFIKPENRGLFVVSERVSELLDGMESFAPPATPKWLTRGES